MHPKAIATKVLPILEASDNTAEFLKGVKHAIEQLFADSDSDCQDGFEALDDAIEAFDDAENEGVEDDEDDEEEEDPEEED